MQKKKMNTKIISLTGMMLVSFFVFALSIQAQEAKKTENKIGAEGTTMAVATVNIYDAKILSQDGTEFKIAFDIYNREMIQSGVKYAVMLFQKDKNNLKLVDEKVYEESLNMYDDYTIKREVNYSAPKFLKGDFEIWVMAQNEKGLPLGQNVAGVATLMGDNNFVEIVSESCFLQVEGEAESKKYDLTQGVDVSLAENLIANCELKNNFSTKQEVVPVFATFNRSVFGEKVAEEKGNSFSMIGSEKMKMSLMIPKISKPQAYDAVLTLTNSRGEIISNSVAFHYVIQGQSATAQNVRLDKDYYAKGETARVSFFGTLSADDFSGARGGGTKIENPRVELVIMDTEKSMCSGIVSKNLDEFLAGTLDVPIAQDCHDPQVKMFVKDKNESVFDSNSAEIVSRNAPPQVKAMKKETGRMALVIFLAVLFLAGASVLMSIQKKKVSSVKKMMMLFLMGMGILSLAGEAKADTFVIANVDYSVQLNKKEYLVKEPIKVFASVSNSGCRNFSPLARLSATVNGNKIEIINANVKGGKIISSGWYSFNGNSTSGNFKVLFNGNNLSSYGSFSGTYQIPYSVKNIDVPTVIPTPTPTPTPAPAPVIPSVPSGNCGSLDQKTSCQAPVGSQLCTSGTASTLKLDTSVSPNKWIWSCGGASSCSALKVCSWKEVNP